MIFSRSAFVVFVLLSVALLGYAILGDSSRKPLEERVVTFCSEADPESFYTGASITGPSLDVSHQIYDTLVQYGQGSTQVASSLAKKWNVSADGTTYTFHLRDGVKWHANANFKPSRDFNADDVVFSIERQWKEDHPYNKVTSANHTAFNDAGLPTLLKSVEKVDDQTVKITLTRPEGPFLSYLAAGFIPVQSKEYADQLLKAGTPEKIDQEPIGTGPFVFAEYRKNAVVRFQAFPQYWAGRARFADLVFAITANSSERWKKLQRGECDVMAAPNPADLEAMNNDSNIMVLQRPRLDVAYLAFNTQKKPFDDVRVRMAFNLAINKSAIIEVAYGPMGIGAINPIPPLLWSYNKSIGDYPYLPTAAKKLLTEAGYAEGFAAELWVPAEAQPFMPDGKRVAEMIQLDLAQIGVKAELKILTAEELRKRIAAGEQQLVLQGWTSMNADPDDFLYRHFICKGDTPGETNTARWCNADFQKLVYEGRTRQESADRLSYYEEAQRLFKKETPWLPIAHGMVITPVRKELADFVVSPFARNSFIGVDINK
jgi:dipeptide transport system substrate-binding protein